MTVKELIEELKKYPENICVITRGYEGGYCEVQTLEIKKIKRNIHTQWYYGPHEDADYFSARDIDKPIEEAILL